MAEGALYLSSRQKCELLESSPSPELVDFLVSKNILKADRYFTSYLTAAARSGSVQTLGRLLTISENLAEWQHNLQFDLLRDAVLSGSVSSHLVRA